jgi:hypothetical protein
MPIGMELDLLAPRAIALERVLPSRELPRANLARALVRVGAIHVRGTLTSTAGDGPEIELESSLGSALAKDLTTLAIDRDTPAELDLAVSAAIDGKLFDDIDLRALTKTSTETLARNVLANVPEVHLYDQEEE